MEWYHSVTCRGVGFEVWACFSDPELKHPMLPMDIMKELPKLEEMYWGVRYVGGHSIIVYTN